MHNGVRMTHYKEIDIFTLKPGDIVVNCKGSRMMFLKSEPYKEGMESDFVIFPLKECQPWDFNPPSPVALFFDIDQEEISGVPMIVGNSMITTITP